ALRFASNRNGTLSESAPTRRPLDDRRPRPAVGKEDRTMRKVALVLLAAVAGATLVVAVATRASGPAAATASSHREAPLISEDPSADNTDLYAFRSPDKPDTVTILSDWVPGDVPAAGPNWYTFSP